MMKVFKKQLMSVQILHLMILVTETTKFLKFLFTSFNAEAAPVTNLLDDEQIAVLLNEDIECVDKENEETEHVLNRIESANLGDCSIFNVGKYFILF
ncbi:hypothetical protein ACI65C_010547 [Semiaphis heraclei]